MIFLVYIATNVSVVVTMIKWNDPSLLALIANRMGWYVSAFYNYFDDGIRKSLPLR